MGNEGDMVLVWNIVSRDVPNWVFSNLGKNPRGFTRQKRVFSRADWVLIRVFFHIGCNWHIWHSYNGTEPKGNWKQEWTLLTSMDA